MDVYGVGVFLLGLSGIGKSECAIELIQRGHRLIADDSVYITRLDDNLVIGKASKILPYHIEIRGIGIVNIQDVFGVQAVRDQKRIDLVVSLKSASDQVHFDRIGDTNKTYNILDVEVASLDLPVRPGRNIAVLIEVACTVFRLRQMGHDPVQSLQDKIDQAMKGVTG